MDNTTTSIKIAEYYINAVASQGEDKAKVGLALAIDDLVSAAVKPLKEEIENLADKIQFLEGRLESRTSFKIR